MIDRLIEKIKKTNAPICVGLDPRIDMVSDEIKEKSFGEFGLTKEGAADAIYKFNRGIIDATYDLIPSVKVQIAMYEELGIPGLIAYEKTLSYAKEKGLIVIGDIKRGDIGSTSKAYANAHLGGFNLSYKGEEKFIEAFENDFVTLNPYMGSDGIDEFIGNCKEFDKGLFILVKTSNPSSVQLQDLVVDEEYIYTHMAKYVASWGKDLVGKNGYSEIGAVVGATNKEAAKTLRKILKNNYFLVPGYGAQGASAKDLSVYFNEDGLGAIVNSSRGIMCAYKSEKYEKCDYMEAARKAVLDMIKDLSENCG